jgi:hypothetical protein
MSMRAKPFMLAVAAGLTLGAGLTSGARLAQASEGEFVSPFPGKPIPATLDVKTQRTTPAKKPGTSGPTHIYMSIYDGYTTDPNVLARLFPEDVNEN